MMRQKRTEESIVQFSRIFTRTGTIWEQTPAHYHERILHKEAPLLKHSKGLSMFLF